MAYDTERKKFFKSPFHFVEIEVNGETYCFCDSNIKPPIGLECIPVLKSVSMSPAKINIEGGLGLRATASITLSEFADYTVYGSVASPKRFWACWRAQNPNYKNQRISIYTGYIPDGVYDASNFVRRDYLIDTFTWTKSDVSMSLVDPLRLANNNNAKLPRESRGRLALDILAADTSLTLAPSGIGDSEYPSASSGDSSTHYLVRINDEIMLVTNRAGDVLTVTRGVQNTTAEDQGADDAVQVCLWFQSQSPSDIDYYLLTTGAGIDTSYIDKDEWDALSDAYFPNSYSAVISEPTGVRELIEDFSQSVPHYHYYDDRYNKIQFVPLRPPADAVQLLTFDGNLLRGQTALSDNQEARVSTVAIYFGVRNPVKDLDEVSNYRQLYVREDSDSVTDYGTRAYKTIYSRWISNDNKSAAVLAAARIGRRLHKPPVSITYQLDPKDADVWTGDDVNIKSDLLLDSVTLEPKEVTYQVISTKEDHRSGKYIYSAFEHTYGAAVAGDEDVENPNTRLLYIAGEQDQLKDDLGNPRTLRDIYDEVYPSDIAADYDVRIIIEPSAVCGSSVNTEYAVKTGAWAELTTPPLIIINGLIVGKGGDGGNTKSAGGNGGPALQLQNDIRLNNLRIIGGGGGGGGGANTAQGSSTANAAGGGGAGFYTGIAGTGTSAKPGIYTSPENGTNTSGGSGGYADVPVAGLEAYGGDGGDLGQAGDTGQYIGVTGSAYSGGTAGKAIDLNGFTITYINTGTIYGAVS